MTTHDIQWQQRVVTCHKALVLLVLLVLFSMPLQAIAAEMKTPRIGVVVMHGKGGSPKHMVAGLADYLRNNGCLVANLEMPWSKNRRYDVSVNDAVNEVKAALDSLRQQGAQRLFVAGHSQGGLFAFHFGGRHRVDGLIAIAPGGNVANQVFREKLSEYLERARALIAEGKGSEKAVLYDWENAKGLFEVHTTPLIYLAWFDPDGAMNQSKAVKEILPGVPVLYIVPERDYPGLIRVQAQMLALMPKNPGNRLYEPDATHTGAPVASKEEILRWMIGVADKR